MDKSIAITKINSFMDVFNELDTPAQKIATLLSVEESALSNPDFRISMSAIRSLFQYAYERSGDKTIGLRNGLSLHRGFSSVLGMLLSSCETVKEMLEQFCIYEQIVDSTSRTSYSFADGLMSIKTEFTVPIKEVSPLYMEYKIAGFISYLRVLLDDHTITPVRISFLHGPMFSPDLYEKLLGCAVGFHNPALMIHFEASIAEMLGKEPNNTLKRLCLKEAGRQLQDISMKESYSSKVLSLLQKRTGGAFNTLSVIAESLAVSERTLQLRLKAEGTTFSELLKRHRKELAITLLKNDYNTVDEIAYLLGFSERQSFHKAFKRWTGKSPVEYRLSGS